MTQPEFKYFAFISYNAKDTAWGKKLQKKLEHYRMPATLCSEHGWSRTPIKPVFFAPTDIQPGGLTEELQERLKASKNLIVICSPNSAQSEWVGKEIEFFHSLGRTKNIHFFIVDGTPHSGNPDTECFNPVVNQLGLPEILGANINERIYRQPWLNRERAYVQLISKLLGVEFDTIWQRHKRQLTRKILAWAIGGIAMIGIWTYTTIQFIPTTAIVTVNDITENENLPSTKGVVTLFLDNEVLVDSIYPQCGSASFNRIPRHRLDKDVCLKVSFKDYFEIDTILPLSEAISINIKRNPDIYGHIRFNLWNPETESLVPNCGIIISDKDENDQLRELVRGTTDSNGHFEIDIPLPQQRIAYIVSSLSQTAIFESNSVYMPCGPNDVILVKQQ